MAWTTPPVFAAGILSAAQLNILSDDVEYLKGISDRPNIPFIRVGSASGIWTGSAGYSVFLPHYLQYLNVRVTWDHGADPGADFSLSVKWGGLEELR